MPISIREITASDTIATLVDKINYNFDQLLLNGGGPMGPIGNQGESGITGPRGSIWFSENDIWKEGQPTYNPENDPFYVGPTTDGIIIGNINKQLRHGDYFLQLVKGNTTGEEDGLVWEFDENGNWILIGSLKGSTGSAGSTGFSYWKNYNSSSGYIIPSIAESIIVGNSAENLSEDLTNIDASIILSRGNNKPSIVFHDSDLDYDKLAFIRSHDKSIMIEGAKHALGHVVIKSTNTNSKISLDKTISGVSFKFELSEISGKSVYEFINGNSILYNNIQELGTLRIKVNDFKFIPRTGYPNAINLGDNDTKITVGKGYDNSTNTDTNLVSKFHKLSVNGNIGFHDKYNDVGIYFQLDNNDDKINSSRSGSKIVNEIDSLKFYYKNNNVLYNAFTIRTDNNLRNIGIDTGTNLPEHKLDIFSNAIIAPDYETTGIRLRTSISPFHNQIDGDLLIFHGISDFLSLPGAPVNNDNIYLTKILKKSTRKDISIPSNNEEYEQIHIDVDGPVKSGLYISNIGKYYRDKLTGSIGKVSVSINNPFSISPLEVTSSNNLNTGIDGKVRDVISFGVLERVNLVNFELPSVIKDPPPQSYPRGSSYIGFNIRVSNDKLFYDEEIIEQYNEMLPTGAIEHDTNDKHGGLIFSDMVGNMYFAFPKF